MKISPNFTLEELTRSDYALRHGLNNFPPPAVLENLAFLAAGAERVRTVLACRMFPLSGYRSEKVNAGVGGSKNSQHVQGLAMDFHPDNMDLREACEKIVAHSDYVDFDQLILEGGKTGWIHVSFHKMPRREVLTAKFNRAGVIYLKGLQ